MVTAGFGIIIDRNFPFTGFHGIYFRENNHIPNAIYNMPITQLNYNDLGHPA